MASDYKISVIFVEHEAHLIAKECSSSNDANQVCSQFNSIMFKERLIIVWGRGGWGEWQKSRDVVKRTDEVFVRPTGYICSHMRGKISSIRAKAIIQNLGRIFCSSIACRQIIDLFSASDNAQHSNDDRGKSRSWNRKSLTSQRLPFPYSWNVKRRVANSRILF